MIHFNFVPYKGCAVN